MENEIGNIIRSERLKKGMTQRELAERCGMYESQIRKYESGKARPKFETLQKIGLALGVFIFDFYGDGSETGEVNIVAPELDSLRSEISQLAYSLNEKGLKKTADYMQDLIEIPEYKIGN